jgi:hypothetical protein
MRALTSPRKTFNRMRVGGRLMLAGALHLEVRQLAAARSV